MAFLHYSQHDAMDCGPTCLRMVAKHYGRSYRLQTLREKSSFSREGVSLASISEAAESIGFRTLGVKIALPQLLRDAPLPCIVHWQQAHFVVVYKITKGKVLVADPAKALLTYTHAEFCQGWLSTQSNGSSKGIALLLEPTPQFFEEEDEKSEPVGFGRLFGYLFSYKKLIVQLLVGLLAGSLLQLLLPFLTQSIVDVGIQTRNLGFVYIVLAAQLMLSAGRVAVEFIRSWILLYISTRINLSILSDFFIKLLRLPLSFFDVKMFGDIMQRINDHDRIEHFLTSTSINVLFSLFNLLLFGGVLAFYNLPIFIVFLTGSALYVGWVLLFLRQRRKLDYKRFALASQTQSNTVQMIQGMQDIKLANAETPMRWAWERLQTRSFKLGMRGLALGQWQQAGAFFINEGKNIFITFLAAQAVINGQLTLGAMMAMQYITGQLNGPIEQLVQFVQGLQDAKISLERLNEIHDNPDEEPAGQPRIHELPARRSLHLHHVGFRYPGNDQPVLSDISLTIPEGKTTAIVGMSGSGKTTLLKLLLQFYAPTQGEIRLGDTLLSNLSHKTWRGACGTVLQDGFIFSDSIARNIAVGEENIDTAKLLHAVNIANIREFIESSPLSYNTKNG